MDQLLIGILGLTWKHVVMFGIGIILIYLAIAKEYEPVLLLPIGFGALLCNIPYSSAIGPEGPLTVFAPCRDRNRDFSLSYFCGDWRHV